MKKTFYEKVGRRYKPVYEYDSELLDSFSKGCHLVVCCPGETSRRYNVDPAFVPMIAAGLYARKAISDAIVRASELRPSKTLITEEQQQAWEALAKAFGDELATLQTNSIYNIVEEGIQTMIREQEKLMKHPSVKKAYDHFLLMTKLAGEDNERTN